MNREDAEEYSQSLGQIVAGSYRQILLADRLGVPKALGLTVPEWVEKRLGGYVKMGIPERKAVVKELAAEGLSVRKIADAVGVKKSQIADDLVHIRTENAPKSAVEPADAASSVQNRTDPLSAVVVLAANKKTATVAQATATRQANEDQRKADLHKPLDFELPEGLIPHDFRTHSHGIPDNSVELVFTDPPYDAESSHLYEAAAGVAARILKPGGSFIAYSGQTQLVDVLTGCSKHLRYWWTVAGVHSGGNQILQKLGIRCGWKPLVWFVKGTRGDVQNILLDVVTGEREKDAHRWQQAEAEAMYYIEHLTSPRGHVVDFFAGGGTTSAAAIKLGRPWTAFEVDSVALESAAKRLKTA